MPNTFVVLVLAFLVGRDAAGNEFPMVTFGAGSLPIILSAPHGGREAVPGVTPRKGIGVPQFTVERDGNTAELAELIAAKLAGYLASRPFIIVARFERKFIDANRPAQHAFEHAAARPIYDGYHRALSDAAEQVRRDWGQGLLLDIHGQGAEANAIFRGTDNGKSVAQLEQRFGKAALGGAKSIFGQLAEKGYKILPDSSAEKREQRYSGGHTTRTYGSNGGSMIDAIQMELGTQLRAKNNLERTANDLSQAIAVFAREYLPLTQVNGSRR